MLLVPLALSAPGLPAGEEVVLTAGAPDGAADEAGDPGAVTTEDLGDVETEAEQAVAAASVGDAVPISSKKASSATSKKKKKKAVTRSTSTTRAKARPPTSSTATTAARAVAAKAPVPLPPPTTAPPATPAPVAGGDDVWDRLAVCESGNTNDPDAPYYGYWQFSEETWRRVGETGTPDEFSRPRQLAAAKRLQAVSGWAPWPECARRLGLR